MDASQLHPRPRFLLVCLALLVACTDDPEREDETMDPAASSGISAGESSTGEGSTSGVSIGDGTGTTSPTSTGTDTGAPTMCEDVTLAVQADDSPVGVVFMVDNVADMTEEAAAISAGLPAFASALASTVDTRVIMISSYPDADPQGVCVEPPLGSGGCPSTDNNPPEYVHIDLAVTPLNAISHVFVTYNQWADLLPPGARRHLVVVSDGDTGVSPEDFRTSFEMIDPANMGYRFHGSVATTVCEGAVVANNFQALINDTNGYVHDLCGQDYPAFFEGLRASITSTGDKCRWEVPPAPEGHTPQPDSIDLLLELPEVSTSPDPVPTVDDCPGDATLAWYWETPGVPTVLVACPTTCDYLDDQAFVNASVRFRCPEDGADGSGG